MNFDEIAEAKKVKSNGTNKLFLTTKIMSIIVPFVWLSFITFYIHEVLVAMQGIEYCRIGIEHNSLMTREELLPFLKNGVRISFVVMIIVAAFYVFFTVLNYRLSIKKSNKLKLMLKIELVILIILLILPLFLTWR